MASSNGGDLESLEVLMEFGNGRTVVPTTDHAWRGWPSHSTARPVE